MELHPKPRPRPSKMGWPEPLIFLEYEVTEWMNRAYCGSDTDRRDARQHQERYEGLVRDVPQGEP